MLERYRFELTGIPANPFKYEWAVRIHGFLNHQISMDDAARFHAFGDSRPYSLYLSHQRDGKTYLILNILNDRALCLRDVLLNSRSIQINGLEKPVGILSMEQEEKRTMEELTANEVKNQFDLHFLSPATYRKDNRFSNWFDLSRLLGNPLAKIKAFEGITIPKDCFYQIDNNIEIHRYNLKSYNYHVTKGGINSFYGGISIRLHDCPELLLAQLNLVLRYAEFTGVGAKTTMGMGGFRIMEADDDG